MSQKKFKQIRSRHLRKSMHAFKGYLISYEIAASWWSTLISWGPFEGMVARHFNRKVERKYKKFARMMGGEYATKSISDK